MSGPGKKALVVSVGKGDAVFLEWQDIKKQNFSLRLWECWSGESWGLRCGMTTALPLGMNAQAWTAERELPVPGKDELWAMGEARI